MITTIQQFKKINESQNTEKLYNKLKDLQNFNDIPDDEYKSMAYMFIDQHCNVFDEQGNIIEDKFNDAFNLFLNTELLNTMIADYNYRTVNPPTFLSSLGPDGPYGADGPSSHDVIDANSREKRYFKSRENIKQYLIKHGKSNSINENKSSKLIDEEKLIELAKSIAFICNGEYGTTYWNKEKDEVFICVGDSNPFDIAELERFTKEIICTSNDYKDEEKIKVTVENESGPDCTLPGWFKFNKKDAFKEHIGKYC